MSAGTNDDPGTHDGAPGAPAAAPTPFKALFTTVHDIARDTHHTPQVHYIFADDDPDLLTAALLASLPTRPPRASPAAPHEHGDRTLLVDLAPDGHSVTAARSLSRDWAVTSAAVQEAPTIGHGAEKAAGGWMLRLEGAGAPATTASTGSDMLGGVGTRQGDALHRAEDLADRWRRELELLRAVRGMTSDIAETKSST